MATTQTSSSTTSSSPSPRRRHAVIACALVVAAALLGLFFLNRLLMPKYMSGIYEGALVAEYYTSEKNHELLVIGDCEVYENISPVTLWEDYGITSYIRGSPQQLIWQSYYLLEDALRYEKPKAVIFSVLAMKYGEPQNEAYNRLTIDGMRLSPSKIAAANASMTEGESLISYLLPIFRYHDRWNALTSGDLRYMFSARGVSFNGFMMRSDVKPLETLPTAPKLADYNFGENSWKYLDKMRELCEDNGVELVLLKAPTLYPHWYAEWDTQITDYAETHGLLYINALETLDTIGIDFSSDTYDAGLHLNLSGAEKLSKYLGNELQARCGLSDLRQDESTAAVWDKMVAEYNALKSVQLKEIETTGKVTTLTRE